MKHFFLPQNDLTIQLPIIITDLQILHEIYRNITKMTDQCQPVNPKMHYVVLTVTLSGCLKLS